MNDWTPETNRIQTMHLTPEEFTAMAMAINANGGEYWDASINGWVNGRSLIKNYVYRAKPAPAPTLSITVNGVTNVVAAGVTEALAKRTRYWMPNPLIDHLTAAASWDDDDVDRERMKRGLIHTSEAAARAHAMAMVGLKAEGVL